MICYNGLDPQYYLHKSQLSSLKHGKYNQIREYQLRMQLLMQLEDSRWAC